MTEEISEDVAETSSREGTSQEPKAGRNLVLCCDGTGNQFGLDNTNVVKLYQILVRDENQIVYYDPGVGTFSGPGYKTKLGKNLSKTLGLAFGDGFSTNLAEAYEFLSEHYREGDRIYCFGFSRGAFMVRALAGLIQVCGLTDPHLHNLSEYAIGLYSQGKVKKPDRSGWEFGKTFGHRPEIRLLGLWDTVSSLGFVWARRTLPFTKNDNNRVQNVRHALAIDERRAYFRQNHWGKLSEKYKNIEQDVVEVWFAGAHSDVGGGYQEEESGLAKIALEWMVAEASQLGLRVDREQFFRHVQARTKTGKKATNHQAPDPLGPRHRSLKNGWWLGEVLPKNHAVEGWRKLTMPLARRRRLDGEEIAGEFVKRETVVHDSVERRLEAANETVIKGEKKRTRGPYRPSNLPQERRVVRTRPVIFDDGSSWDPNAAGETDA